MKKAAFTLIELLVVISIIAILAAIALPVFSSAQEKARATQDASNLKNLGIGIAAYLNDNDDQMFGKADPQSWPLTLQKKYVTDWKVFKSPFDKRPEQNRAPGAPVSYGINTNLFDVNASKFVAPSELILAAPSPTPGPQMVFAGLSENNVDLPMPDGSASKQGTHSSRNMINAVFADAHVSTLTWRDYSTTSSEAGLRKWWPTGKAATE